MRSYFAVPTDHTKERIRRILASAPITLEFDKMVVPLALNTNIQADHSGKQFSATVIDFGHWYNEELQHTQMAASLQSPDMVRRAIDLGAGTDYQPRWVIQESATPLARTNKFWLKSVETILVVHEKSEPFTFVEQCIDA